MPVNNRSTLDNWAARASAERLPAPACGAPRVPRPGWVAVLVVTACLSTASVHVHAPRAFAQEARVGGRASAVHHVVAPPAPEEHGATLAVEVHGGSEIPLARDTICPANADCVLGLGLGVGAQIERRSSDRIGLFAAYDFWLLDSGGVYEIGALHGIRGGLRYVLDDSLVVHPFLEVAAGLVVFGDTADVATVGGAVTGGGGAEIELSESVAFVTAAEAWVFATGPFRTRDGIARAADFGVNVALQLTVGISVIVGPVVAPPGAR